MELVQLRLSTWLRASVAMFHYAALSASAQAAVPVYRPTEDAHIVLRLANSGAESELARLRKTVNDAPQDAGSLARYANALIVAGKQSGNERYYGYAEKALSDAPQEVQRALTLLQAQLLQHRHDFKNAEQALDTLLTGDPRHREARLMRAQVRLHLNKPNDAMRDCVALMPLVDLLTSTTCFSQARAALGDVRRAYALIVTALQAPNAPDSTRSFGAGIAAELAARLGNNDAASQWYQTSFELDKESHYPRIAYADWLLSQGQDRKALAIASAGGSNADKLRVVIAEGNAQSLAAQQLQLGWTEAAANGERTHLRDQARFEMTVLRDAKRAHATALDNFRDHHEAEDALLLVATAASVHDNNALTRVQAWCAERNYIDIRIESVLASRI